MECQKPGHSFPMIQPHTDYLIDQRWAVVFDRRHHTCDAFTRIKYKNKKIASDPWQRLNVRHSLPTIADRLANWPTHLGYD